MALRLSELVTALRPGDDHGLAACGEALEMGLGQDPIRTQVHESLQRLAKLGGEVSMLDLKTLPDPGPMPAYEAPEYEPPPSVDEEEAFDKALAGGDRMLTNFFVQPRERARRAYARKLKKYREEYKEQEAEVKRAHHASVAEWKRKKNIFDTLLAGQPAKDRLRKSTIAAWEKAQRDLVQQLQRWAKS